MAGTTYVEGQKRRIRMGCRYDSITAMAADDRIALNYTKHARSSTNVSSG